MKMQKAKKQKSYLLIGLIVLTFLQLAISAYTKYLHARKKRENDAIIRSLDYEMMHNNKLQIQITAYQNQDVVRKMMEKHLPEYSMIKPTHIITIDQLY